MKKITILLLACLLFTVSHLYAQKCDIPLLVLMPQQTEEFPEAVEASLENKLIQIAALNGVAAGHDYTQFVLQPKITVMSIDIVAGPPRNVALNLEVTLYVADFLGDKVFATTTVNAKGVGANDTKAYMDAIKRINTKSPEFKKFVERAKAEIIKYYDDNSQNLITKAQSLANLKKYDEAMYYLISVPNCSKNYQAALDASAEVYRKYVDDLCQQYLGKARAAWTQEQNAKGAGRAGESLQYIYPDAKCYDEAMALYKEIDAKMKGEWDFTMKAYNDSVDIEQQRVEAWKEVGVAFGKNQQPGATATEKLSE
jgi:hypothetical protein